MIIDGTCAAPPAVPAMLQSYTHDLEWSIVGSLLDPQGNGFFHGKRAKAMTKAQYAAQVLLMPP